MILRELDKRGYLMVGRTWLKIQNWMLEVTKTTEPHHVLRLFYFGFIPLMIYIDLGTSQQTGFDALSADDPFIKTLMYVSFFMGQVASGYTWAKPRLRMMLHNLALIPVFGYSMGLVYASSAGQLPANGLLAAWYLFIGAVAIFVLNAHSARYQEIRQELSALKMRQDDLEGIPHVEHR